jgi:hypothetical protein
MLVVEMVLKHRYDIGLAAYAILAVIATLGWIWFLGSMAYKAAIWAFS